MIEKVVSGGQTGVDRAALDSALKLGIATGGWCPKNRKSDNGPIPLTYPLTETPSVEYDQRTEWNVRDSDGTLILCTGIISGGSLFTKSTCLQTSKPCCVVNLTDPAPFSELLMWLDANHIAVLNVAGPRESQSPGIYDSTCKFLGNFFEQLLLGRRAIQPGTSP